jgi:hypothetical protein
MTCYFNTRRRAGRSGMPPFLSALFLALILLFGAVPASAQTGGAFAGPDPVAQRLARPGEATIRVLYLSDIGSGGVFDVGESIRFDEFLVLAGATTVGPEVRGEVRTVTVRVYREGGQQRTLVYEAPFREVFDEPERHPRLQPGDVVMLDVTVRRLQLFTWRDGLSLVSTAASLTYLILRISRWGFR